jgi:Protein of unknown function (DUF2958)
MLVTEICPDELRSLVPPLHSQEGIDDPIVHLKFFTESGLIRYATEGSAEENFVLFGFVIGPGEEWGEHSLSELTASARSGLEIQRDVHFKPRALQSYHIEATLSV